jgi:hypothetical protein
MGDYRRSASPYGIHTVGDANSVLGHALIASARVLTGIGDPLIQKREWQREAWDFYHAMGEFWYGVTWKANAMSRVRLVAAKLAPGGDEPEILRDDQVGDPGEEDADAETSQPRSKLTEQDRKVVGIVERFGGGIGKQSAILKSLTVQLSVPGEGFVVGEQRVLDEASGTLAEPTWSVKSADEIRRKEVGTTAKRTPKFLSRIGPGVARGESRYEVQIEENMWMPLSAESLVCRVWSPDEQFHWRASSAALAALPILREIDLYNRRIIADIVSRLASNGILLMPQEATFATNPAFKDAADPFIAEFIDTASKAIKNPGSASAAIPIPIKVPAELVDKFVHLTFAAAWDSGILDARDRALRRLAVTMEQPEEVLTGVQNVNHWTAWQIDESGIKIHIAPMAEIVVDALTMGYLTPMMEAASIPLVAEDGSRYVMWYDVSELTAKPDLGEAAEAAHANGAISDMAYRREKGFTEDDAPSDDELQKMILRFLSFQGNAQAMGQLFPDLADAMAPPTPGYDAEGRPLPPPDSVTTETVEETVDGAQSGSERGKPSTTKKPTNGSPPNRPTPSAVTTIKPPADTSWVTMR